MKILFMSAAFACCAVIGQAQAVPSNKVLQSFESSALSTMADEQVKYYNFIGANSYVVHNEAKTKDGLPLLSSVLKPGKPTINGAELNQENFNPFDYNVTPLPSEAQFFLIDGTSKVVQFHSKATIDMQYDWMITNERNQAKGQNK